MKKPQVRILPYNRHLFHSDTSDSQEPGFSSGDMSPSTPVEIAHVFKTPSVCPPTPIKTPSTQKKRKNDKLFVSSSTPLFSSHNGGGLSDENGGVIRSSKIKRAAVSPSPAPKRICASVDHSVYSNQRQPLIPIQTPFRSTTSTAVASAHKRRIGSSKKVFKALQFEDDEDVDDDQVVDDEEQIMDTGIGLSTPKFVFNEAMNTSGSSEELFGNDMEDDLVESPLSVHAASPGRLFSPQKNRNGSPVKTAVPGIVTTPPSPELFGCGSDYTDSDEDLVSSDEEPEFEGFTDLATQSQMPSCTPPKFSLSMPVSPPNVQKVACRLTTETVHQNPFSPERAVKSRARRSISKELDTMDLAARSEEEKKESKNDQNDSYLIGYFSRYLEDFTEVAVLGDGSFGKVTKCQNRFDGICYAVKQTKKKFRGSKDRDLMLKEIQALATLVDNPYIVRYFSAWIEDDRLFVQTELCEGGSWADKIKTNHVFHEGELIDILRQICTGLQQMHAQNIVHLDIKPENIYTTASDKYKIGDLGLAASSYAELRDVNEGDSRYLAKEVLSGEYCGDSELTKVDIFALGASIYESASGRPLPNNGAEWHEIRDGNLKYMQEPQYSRELIEMVKMMIHPDPKQRPSALDILQSDLVRSRRLDYDELLKQVHVLEEMLRKQKQTEEILRGKLKETGFE